MVRNTSWLTRHFRVSMIVEEAVEEVVGVGVVVEEDGHITNVFIPL